MHGYGPCPLEQRRRVSRGRLAESFCPLRRYGRGRARGSGQRVGGRDCFESLPRSGKRSLGNIFRDAPRRSSEKTNRLASAVVLANRKIFESARQNPLRHGMGATVTALWLNGQRMSIAHVGDSRAYLLRTGALEQLTRDHSLVAEQVRRGILTPQPADRSE